MRYARRAVEEFQCAAAIACNRPPIMPQRRISQGQRPPCRFRASSLVTVLNHRAVAGRLRRQAMSGETTSRSTEEYAGQKLPTLLPSQASLNVKRPSRTSRVLNKICTGRDQSQTRRMPSPKMAMPAAKGREMRNVTTAAGTGLNFSIDVGSCTNPDPVRLRKTKGRRGPASSCTVKPQSKATAMPMPWGTRFFAVGDSTGSDWPAGSDCRMSFIVISPALVSLWCYLATYQICVLEGMSREGGHKDPTPL